MKSIDEVRELAKRVRNGEQVEGVVYTKDMDAGREFVFIEEDNKTYLISGTFRIKVVEYDVNNPMAEEPKKANKPKREFKPIKKSTRPRDENGKVITTETVTCAKCGKTFEKSIYQKTDQCPECRGAKMKRAVLRDADGKLITTEKVKCAKCGKEFERSIYNPQRTECFTCKPTKKRASKEPAVARTLTCAHCGKTFEVTKFQPYWTADMGCPECRKNIAKQMKKAKKEQTKAAEKSTLTATA